MNRKIINKGIYNENQSVSGGTVYNVVGNQNAIQSSTGLSLEEFQGILNQVQSQLRTTILPESEKDDIEAILAQVVKQSQKKEPKKSLIVEPLKTAFELMKQAGGAATAAVTIAQLLQKAIEYAQNLF
jgi:hypothetical protein